MRLVRSVHPLCPLPPHAPIGKEPARSSSGRVRFLAGVYPPNPPASQRPARNAALASSSVSATRPPDAATDEALAAAPVARQTGRVAQCPLTDTNSCL